MVSQIGSSAGFSTAALSGTACRGSRDPQAMQEKLFNKLDVNGDGGIDETELGQFLDFASSASGGTSQTDSATLLKSLDSDGNGSVSKTELADGAKSLFDQLRSQLMSSSSESQGVQRPEPPDAKEMFSKMDSNTDGSISEDELGAFMQANPPPSSGGEHGGGLFSAIETLLDQYRSNASSDTSSAATRTLAVAA